MKKLSLLLTFLVFIVGCSSSSNGIELETIINHWSKKAEAFSGYDLSIGEFNDDVARIGNNVNTILSLNLNSNDTVRNYTTLVRNGYAENNIEELAIILGLMITAPLQENPSLSLSDIENLKDYIETETNFDAQGHQIRFSGDKSDTFYMHVYINAGD